MMLNWGRGTFHFKINDLISNNDVELGWSTFHFKINDRISNEHGTPRHLNVWV